MSITFHNLLSIIVWNKEIYNIIFQTYIRNKPSSSMFMNHETVEENFNPNMYVKMCTEFYIFTFEWILIVAS